ncbi:LacI family DNA-binding transcriptional regulator [Jannaschia sp. M317]|uniref:LacI family DNA-binding transcriptional regulator n=1 Tax=Jannaschia sp. M317 TaxID=2867011 RepID=UPI0021A4917D|nr:LacI family DNA-binding transcriptional regulator [Jannaschia sp. M317]UWQ16854.1 LacI family DNA-binding transcriptional regulator [Jannaschia sp. M317]
MKHSTKPTLKDVAAQAGVSLISASRVMRDAPHISAKLRAKVQAAATDLGYTPNRIAGSLRGQTTDLIAVIVPSMSNHVFSNIVDGINDAFVGTSFRTVLGLTHYNMAEEEEVLRDLMSWNPSAVIISGLEHSDGSAALLRAAECPVVEVMDTDGAPIDSSVGFSQRRAGRLMADHLHANGYRRIGYVGAWGERPVRSLKRRLAFEERLAELGTPLAARHITDAASSFAAGAESCQILLGAHPDLDALFFANDDLALGAMFHCMGQGMAVPGDIAIGGFNGLEMRDGIHPRLTTIRTPRTEIGRRAGQMVLARLRGGGGEGPSTVDLPLDLLVGETTRPRT